MIPVLLTGLSCICDLFPLPVCVCSMCISMFLYFSFSPPPPPPLSPSRPPSLYQIIGYISDVSTFLHLAYDSVMSIKPELHAVLFKVQIVCIHRHKSSYLWKYILTCLNVFHCTLYAVNVYSLFLSLPLPPPPPPPPPPH